MKLGRLLKATSVAFVPLVAGVLFLMVPASAQNNGQDPDIRMSIDIGEIREGRRATLTFSFVDGQPDMVDRHVYVAISGTATEGSQADFTITGSNGSSLPSIGDTLYNRKIVIPAGATSAYARINVRNDNDAEQCEVVKIEGLWRDQDSDAKAFLGIFELRIPANDLDRPGAEMLPSVSLAQEDEVWTAALNDPAASGRQTWTWDRSTRADGPWTEVAYDSASYTPEEGDGAYYLRAEVRYDTSPGTAACAHIVWQGRGTATAATPPRQHQPRQHQPRQHQPRQHQPRQHQPRQHQPRRREPGQRGDKVDRRHGQRQHQRRRREPGQRGDKVDRRHGQLFGSRLGRRAHEGCAYPLRGGGVRRHRMQRWVSCARVDRSSVGKPRCGSYACSTG